MRVALLSALDGDPHPGQERAAFARFAGARIIERQMELAIELGCTTVACLVDSVGREIIDLQHKAERAGARFVALRELHPLGGLITTSDELLVFAAGVLPDDAALARHLSKPSILVFPAEIGVPLGYELVNADYAWSGVLLARGAIVEQVLSLPSDSDVPSALLRSALQFGTKVQPLGKSLIDANCWHIRASQSALADREAKWIRRHARPSPFTAPGVAVGERIGIRLAEHLLGSAGEKLPWVAAMAGALATAILVAIELPALAFGFAALTTFLITVAITVERIGNGGAKARPRSLRARMTQWLTDPALALLLALSSPESGGWFRWFAPIMLFGLLQLGARISGPDWRPSYSDRIATSVVLAPFVFLGLAQEATAIAALLALGSLFLTSGRDK